MFKKIDIDFQIMTNGRKLKIILSAFGTQYRIYVLLIILTHFALTFLMGLFRHWGYLTSINDTGHFDQAIWGTIHGNLLLNTDVFNIPSSRLGMHFDPIQLIFVPLYLFAPSVLWLTAGQSLATAITAWPIFIIANRVFKSDSIGLMWALIFLVNPFLLNATVWDFHPITLATPFVALGFLAVESKNLKLMGFSVLMLLLCKEHLGIMVIGFGFLWLIKNREWKPSITLMIIGFVHFYVVLKIIMPLFSPTGQHIMISMESGFSRYGWLGQSVNDIVSTILTHPFFVLKKVFIEMGGSNYLFLLLLPFIGFSILGWPFLFPAAADLAVNMLSSINMPRSPIAYHSITLVPIFTVAAIHGVKKASKWIKRFSTSELIGLSLVASIVTGYLFAPFPLPGAANVWAPISFINLPDHRVSEIKALIGEDASISAQANIGGHFSQRKEIYRFPNKTKDVDSVILWLDSPTENIHMNTKSENGKHPLYIGMLDCHLQMDRNDYLHSVESIMENKNFGVVYWNDPWLVLKRSAGGLQDVSGISNKLEKLRRAW